MNRKEAGMVPWTYMELLLVVLIRKEPADCGVGGRGVLLKYTGQSLMKPHGLRFQSEITELLCLLCLKRMSRSEERFPGSYINL